MNVILFGATGMVGQGVLRECLLDPGLHQILSIVHTPSMFRPGFIQPLHGIRSKTKPYQFFYTTLNPILPLFKSIFPKSITTTEELARAMLCVAKHGYPKPILEVPDIVRAASPAS